HRPPASSLFPYTTLFRSVQLLAQVIDLFQVAEKERQAEHLDVGVHAGEATARECRALQLADTHLAQHALVVAHHATRIEPERNRSEEHTSELQSRENLVC